MRHLASVLVLFLLSAAIAADAASPEPPAPPDLPENASQWITHLSVDRPVVRPGETLRVRGVLLDALTREPAPAEAAVNARWEVAGPRGEVVAQGSSATRDGVLGVAWAVPASLDGGRYTLKATYPHEGLPPAERGFEVRAFRAPTLKTQVVFLRDGYGPGDEVRALLAVERAEGGAPPTDATVTAVARLDGAEVFRGSAELDEAGNASVGFPLPRGSSAAKGRSRS